MASPDGQVAQAKPSAKEKTFDFKTGEILAAYKARRETFDPSNASDDHLFGLPLVQIGYDILIELLKRHNPDKILANVQGTAQDRATYRPLKNQDLYNRLHQATVWYDENNENGTTSRVALELEIQEARRQRGLPPLKDAFVHAEDGDNVLRWSLLQHNDRLRHFLVLNNCNIGYPRSQQPQPRDTITRSRRRSIISQLQQTGRVATSAATQPRTPSRLSTVTTSTPSIDSRAPVTIESLTAQRDHFRQLSDDLWREISRYDDAPEDLIDHFHESNKQLRDTENILRLKLEEQTAAQDRQPTRIAAPRRMITLRDRVQQLQSDPMPTRIEKETAIPASVQTAANLDDPDYRLRRLEEATALVPELEHQVLQSTALLNASQDEVTRAQRQKKHTELLTELKIARNDLEDVKLFLF